MENQIPYPLGPEEHQVNISFPISHSAPYALPDNNPLQVNCQSPRAAVVVFAEERMSFHSVLAKISSHARLRSLRQQSD